MIRETAESGWGSVGSLNIKVLRLYSVDLERLSADHFCFSDREL